MPYGSTLNSFALASTTRVMTDKSHNARYVPDCQRTRNRPHCRTRLILCALSFHVAWWSQSGSNRRPPACKAGALPAELWPRDKYKLVGLGGLEPPTSPLSGVRSNHLSYRPRSDPSMECRKLVRTPTSGRSSCSKGGDPAAPSDTATLLRLHPSHRPHRGKRPPEG